MSGKIESSITNHTDIRQNSPINPGQFINGGSGRNDNSNVFVPWQLAERARIYADRNRTTVTNVIVEAVDFFIRQRT